MANCNPHNKPSGENYYASLHGAILASAEQLADTLPLTLDEVFLASEDTAPTQALHTVLKRRFPSVDNSQDFLKEELKLLADDITEYNEHTDK
ncbi:hypothetical protein [Corynebacterium pseudogenitalium]|uniref:Transposase n=1 Tax=Corynebacterium pseudogenitalium TaxID=38303 RepID=A0ABD4TTU5_9CORY|nr:hypothetical protein [Corynebacterium pseudogenitalium]MCQ4615060.1 hypothetical protein [Corynebacterium pseudogenitalium]